jgi:nitrogen regulatory protein P-II 1
MKLVIAIIQPDKLEEVHHALVDAEIVRITVSRCTGHGQAEDPDLYRGQEVRPSLLPKVRIEIAVNDAFVQQAVDAIVTAAKHDGGTIGDGKIFVLPLDDCVRIRTGEHGGDAV